MWKRLLLGFAGILAVVIAIVVVRTFQLSHEPSGVHPVERSDFDAEGALERLSTAVQIPTISHQDTADTRHSDFERFIAFMEASYPNVHENLTRERVGANGYTLLYRWEGRDTTRRPALMMGHYDVVPVEEGTEKEWTHPAFSGDRSGGFIWGRGTIDDTSGLLSLFEAVEYLLSNGYRPQQTIYLIANHDEEVGGTRGAARAADLLKERDVKLDFVVDEGLPVAEEILQGIESPLALIGVAEKGSLTLELEVIREGGHASMPPRRTAIGDLASAIRELKTNPMPSRFGRLLQNTFEPISSDLPFVYRMGLANLWLFRPIIKSKLAKIPHTNAAMRTTIAPTIFQSGMKTNVLPAHAEAVVNFRIHPRDSVEDVVDHVRSTIDDPDVNIQKLGPAREPSPVSNVESASYQQFKQSIWETFGEIPVVPSLFVAASDSRYFHDFTRNIYRFRPIRARPSDRKRIHGTNERIGVENYKEMIHFQIRLLKNTTAQGDA